MTKLEKRHLICVYAWEMFLLYILVTEMEILSWELSKKKFLISYDKAILSH